MGNDNEREYRTQHTKKEDENGIEEKKFIDVKGN